MDYLKLFENHSQYESYAGGDMPKPNVSHCVEENEVHYNPIPDPYNGHAYVDLGLPSGTMWATMNVGATSETDYGLYFAWGETQGYTASQVPSEKKFGWMGDNNDYSFTQPDGINWEDTFDYGMTKYNSADGLANLELSDDAAHVNWGGDWRTPTMEQCEELCNTAYVTNTWVENYQNSGVNGRLFTSVSNGNTLFIPAEGSCYDGEVNDVGLLGGVWSSFSENMAQAYLSWRIYFTDGGVANTIEHRRCEGLSVRGVVGQN